MGLCFYYHSGYGVTYLSYTSPMSIPTPGKYRTCFENSCCSSSPTSHCTPFQHKEEKKKDREKWSAVASQIQARMDKIDWKLKKRKERAYKVDCSSGYISNTLINSWTKKKITWQKIYTSTFSMTNDIYRKRSLKETNI